MRFPTPGVRLKYREAAVQRLLYATYAVRSKKGDDGPQVVRECPWKLEDGACWREHFKNLLSYDEFGFSVWVSVRTSVHLGG